MTPTISHACSVIKVSQLRDRMRQAEFSAAAFPDLGFMLRITRQYSAAAVKKYYEHSDYYTEGPNALQGYWFGKAAKKLGLEGVVDKTMFDRVVENRHPVNDNQSLTSRTRADRVIGADFTFNVPKSVSIIWALTQDHRILDAVREAVSETLEEIEQDVETRVHEGKEMHREKTGNVIGASWLHTTARPEDGVPMPHLHVHAWIANATHDGNKFKAIDFANVKADGPYFEARFHSRLASKLQDTLGVATQRQGKKWFEVKGVPRNIVELYSERTQKIEQVARDKRITNPEQKAQLGAKTRQGKTKTIPADELPGMWRWMLSEGAMTDLRDDVMRAGVTTMRHVDAKAAVDYAIGHQFSKKSTVKERRLMTDAIWRGMGDVPLADIDEEHGKRTFVRRGESDKAWVTTPEILKEEQFILRFARKGLGSVKPLAADAEIERVWLSDEQQDAVRKLWNSKDRVQVLAGKAGVGKTTSATEAVEGIQQHGHDVIMLGPTTKSVKVLEQDGFKPNTLEKFLTNEKLQATAAGQVIWLDESGLVSTIDMARLFHVAKDIDARVILSGDRFQHKAVERGKALELLETESGIKPIEINTIRRQEDDRLRWIVTKLSGGETKPAFKGLEKLKAFTVLPDETRDKQLARQYWNAIESGETALVIAPTNIEKDEVTGSIRDEAKLRGHISTKECKLVTYKRYEWDKAERQDPVLYSTGDIAVFRTRGKNGFQPGDKAEVVEVRDHQVMVRHGEEIKELPLASAGGFAVFKPIEKMFADGDVIKITQNRGAKAGLQRLNNGDVAPIKFRKDGQIDLGNGVSFDPVAFPYFDHGVVTTSFSAQGDGKDRVFISQSTKSFPASAPDQAYVSVSRAKRGVHIFTDDLDGLRKAVNRSGQDESATSLARRVKRENDKSRVKQRIDRLRHQAKRGRDFVQQQVRRLAQFLPNRSFQTPALSR